ncbi:Uncharacterized conserved protein, DUF1778 family [Rhizobiales bacterium GAS188]|nr:Uncharacterized conserved protein, DUF1778 family [Rhizobiales bacterium GAS188]
MATAPKEPASKAAIRSRTIGRASAAKRKPAASAARKEARDARPRKAASETNVSMRISLAALDLISSAAASEGKTRTEFMLESARRRATEVLLERRLFVLDDEQHAAFIHVLDNPPAPSARLRRLMSAPSPWEE